MADSEFPICEALEETNEDVFDVESTLQGLQLTNEDSDIPHWLQHVESPFNWMPKRFSDVPPKEVISKATERIEMDEGFEATFPFQKFVRIMTLVYEFSCQGEEGKACEQLTLCGQLIEDEKDKDVATYNKLRTALIHTVQATRAHLLSHAGKMSEAKQIADSIQPVSSLPKNDQAAIQAVKARFFYLYRNQGTRLAVQCAKMALTLAPDEPLWQVLTAESVRRLRKFLPSTDQVSEEEVLLLESAVSKQRNARHLVLLAQAHRESADAMFKQHRSDPDLFHSQVFLDISDMQAKAFELYKEALSLRPDDEVVNRLCGYGLLKLPAFKSDYRLAEHCLQRALELSPNNPTTIHSLGLYYYKGLMEYEKAALFCEKAGKLGNFPASLDMLRMKHLVYGANYDPKFDFRKLLQQYGDDETKRHEVLCQMGSYFLFFERNLVKALKYFKILIKEEAELTIMTSHKCTFLNMARKINLFQCIVNEGTLLLQGEIEANKEEENSLNDVKTFLDELKISNPELFDHPVNKNLVDDLHKVSDDIKQTYLRKKERRDSLKEKRRNSSRRGSLEDNFAVIRRHSEGGANFRRRSSGNINDNLMARRSRNPNNLSYKQKKLEKLTSSNLSESEKSSNIQKKQEFHKSHGYYRDAIISNFRHRSSGASSDVSEGHRSPNSPKHKQHFFETRQISEPISESSRETWKKSRDRLGSDAIQSNGYQTGNNWSQSKRHQSWNSSSEKPINENWRRKDENN
ncbi:uncharacterized protein LOC124359794 [Homalodisca vitripennis]|uniref:uncharacterized protein LOC124359794 n=1 Tax=Homalodisca vitripennis TaxID=197043 RepID=UPI001EEB5C8A|nr:uncharacterized protein LOC124359794 [Homalodisca vitripennis]